MARSRAAEGPFLGLLMPGTKESHLSCAPLSFLTPLLLSPALALSVTQLLIPHRV